MHFIFETPLYEDDNNALTGYRESDVAEHLRGEDEETARRFGWWPKRSTSKTVMAAFRSWGWDWAHDGPSRTFAVRDRDGRLLGGCQLKRRENAPWTVSYWTGVSRRRQGIATRALRLLLLYAYEEGITELECHISEDNIPSRRSEWVRCNDQFVGRR
jgi:RimJ/RimL family protein N-acetyltransferase